MTVICNELLFYFLSLSTILIVSSVAGGRSADSQGRGR